MAKFDIWNGGLIDQRPNRVSPFEEAGRSGTAIYNGYVYSGERNAKVQGRTRYETAQDVLVNSAVVGAGMRFFLDLVSYPKWSTVAAGAEKDGKASDEAKRVADFVTEQRESLTDSWARCVRRMAASRFYGFGIHEWTAVKIQEGQWSGSIGMESLESRPWQTIEQWDTNLQGTVYGVVQRVLNSAESDCYIPRGKFVYLVDDAFSDSPEGIGLWRHLVEPYERFKAYCKIESMGFERDLRGIPVGYAPLGDYELDGLTAEQIAAKIKPLTDFVSLQAKKSDTAIVLDSSTYVSQGETQDSVSPVKKYGIELMTASGNGFADIGNAIDRAQYQMALLCGTETMLTGAGREGSRALSDSQAKALSMRVDSCAGDIVAATNRDFIAPLMRLNNIPRELWPKAKIESSQYTDVLTKSQLLVNLANAGAVLSPEDPAVNELRLEAGLLAAAGDIMSLDAMNTGK